MSRATRPHSATTPPCVAAYPTQVRSGTNGGVPNSMAESALKMYATVKLGAKGWRRVGRYYAHGDFFGKTASDLALVRMVRVQQQCRNLRTERRSACRRTARKCLSR